MPLVVAMEEEKDEAVERELILALGRIGSPDAVQALCFLAGANSVFYGEKLLTTGNPAAARDRALFAQLGLKPA